MRMFTRTLQGKACLRDSGRKHTPIYSIKNKREHKVKVKVFGNTSTLKMNLQRDTNSKLLFLAFSNLEDEIPFKGGSL
jgi:hypothetical protein